MADREVQISKNTAKKTSQSTVNPSKEESMASTSKTAATTPITGKSSSNKTSGKAPASSGKAPQVKEAGGVNKEVLLILQEMNANLNAQKERLEKQEQKLDFFTEQYSNPQDYMGVDHEEYVDYVELESESSTVENENEHSMDNSNSNGLFKSLRNKFQQTEQVDNEVDDDLAQFVNSSFKNGLSDEKKSELLKDVHRPRNCEALTKTRVNQGIWRLLKSGTQYDDNIMQSVQELIVKATSNIVKMTDKKAHSDGKLDEEEMNWSTNAIALLGHANKQINVRRKEAHKSDLDPKYHYLASPTIPFTEFLYGEDTDINKNIKEINELNRLGRNLGRGYNPRGTYRGYPSLRRFNPYSRGGRGRGGRGRPFPTSTATKNTKMAPKK